MLNDQLLIKELTSEAEWEKAFPVMKQLRTQLNLDTYLTLVSESVQKKTTV